jgi:hypothetical protein
LYPTFNSAHAPTVKKGMIYGLSWFFDIVYGYGILYKSIQWGWLDQQAS